MPKVAQTNLDNKLSTNKTSWNFNSYLVKEHQD